MPFYLYRLLNHYLTETQTASQVDGGGGIYQWLVSEVVGGIYQGVFLWNRKQVCNTTLCEHGMCYQQVSETGIDCTGHEIYMS